MRVRCLGSPQPNLEAFRVQLESEVPGSRWEKAKKEGKRKRKEASDQVDQGLIDYL